VTTGVLLLHGISGTPYLERARIAAERFKGDLLLVLAG